MPIDVAIISLAILLYRYTRLYLLMIGISVLVRPTGAILWPPLVLAHFLMGRKHILIVIKEAFGMG